MPLGVSPWLLQTSYKPDASAFRLICALFLGKIAVTPFPPTQFEERCLDFE